MASAAAIGQAVWWDRRPAAAGPREELGRKAGSRMRDDGRPTGDGSTPDALSTLDAEYAGILAMLDRSTAITRIVAGVPRLTGVATAWVGELGDRDAIVLGHTVNAVTDQVDGLVVPVGAGLGGRVVLARRPLWLRDYFAARDITQQFHAQASAEGVKAMVAVPIAHEGRVLGVLYGANREVTEFGDRTIRALECVASRMATAQVVAERARYAAEVAVHEERRRLALELHDNVGAMLFTLGAGIRRLSCETHLDADVRARLAAMEQQAAEASAALRGSLRALHAPPDQVALPVALRGHCRAFADRTGTDARIITLTDLPGLPDSRVRALADAVREALLNVEKHARASSVIVSVFAARGGVAVTVVDDGAGLDPEPCSAGLGLAATAELLARVGGTLSVAPGEEGGVTLQAWVPA